MRRSARDAVGGFPKVIAEGLEERFPYIEGGYGITINRSEGGM